MNKIVLGFLMFFLVQNIDAQLVVKGKVVDGLTNEPISNVEIKTKKTSEVAKSNEKGDFELSNLKKNSKVTFSLDGYTSAGVKLTENATIKVVLFPYKDPKSTVDMGYGEQSSRSVTSSVTVLESSELNKEVSADIYSYLRGKVPGLSVMRATSNVTDEPQLMLRGTAGLSGNYAPLIVIDGIQGISLTSLDPNDVASVTVLKDSSAQAIYGSQASGGVIIIKTKRRQ
jgi:TonB-dependent starch-binding outer membrane protein SusC